jgi:3,4-dihydroxy 2-butanone 4-phosphate synthase/GTP cyclohydrolase II
VQSLFADLFGEQCKRGGLLEGAMRIIGEEGSGVIVVLPRAMGGGRLSKTVEAHAGKTDGGMGPEELRDYGVGAQILTELGVQDMILLTNSHHTLVALDGYGLSIVGERPIPCSGDQ